MDSTLAEVLQVVTNGEVKKLAAERFALYKMKAAERGYTEAVLSGGHAS